MRKTTAQLALPILTVLLLCVGCVKLDSSFVINQNETIDVAMLIGIQQQYASMAGVGDDMCAAFRSQASDLPPEVTMAQANDDDYVACRVTFSAPLEKFTEAAASSGGGVFPLITRDAGEYRFTLHGPEDSGSMGAAMYSSLRVAVTFPGEVTSHNGASTVEGTTVTWTLPKDLVSDEGLQATGKDSSGLLGLPIWIIGGVGAALLVGLVGVIVARRQRSPRTTPPADGTPPTPAPPSTPPSF